MDWSEVDRGICSWITSIFTITDDMILRYYKSFVNENTIVKQQFPVGLKDGRKKYQKHSDNSDKLFIDNRHVSDADPCSLKDRVQREMIKGQGAT